MGRRRAYENLVAAGTNALCAAGLSLSYADVSEEQKEALGMTGEEGYTVEFEIDEVPCVAVSKPAGAGEERILVIYNSSDKDLALSLVGCPQGLKLVKNGAVAKFTLERKTGPYIMREPLTICNFRSTNTSNAVLDDMEIQPYGYTLNGPFIL